MVLDVQSGFKTGWFQAQGRGCSHDEGENVVWLAGFCCPIGDGLKLLGICSTLILINVHQKIEIALENNKQGAQGGAGWVLLAAARGHGARSHRAGLGGEPGPRPQGEAQEPPSRNRARPAGQHTRICEPSKSCHASAMRGFIKF